MVISCNNCLPFPLGSRVFLPKTARASSHAYFSDFHLALSRLLDCLSTQRCIIISAKRHLILREPKPVFSHHSLPPGSHFFLKRIAVERAVPVPGLPSHHRVRKVLRRIQRPRSSPDIVALVQRWVDKAATQAFEVGRQVYAGANAFLRFHVAPFVYSEPKIP